VDDDCLQELRWFYDRRDLGAARRDIAQRLAKWQAKYPRLCNWVEDNIEETLTPAFAGAGSTIDCRCRITSI
jgi:putative transposase